MASVWQLPSGAWRWQVHTGRRLGADRWARASGTAPSRRMAEQAAARVQARVMPGRAVADPTVTEWVGRYLDDATDRLAPSTLHTYRGYVDRWIIPRIGDRRISTVSGNDIKWFLDSLDAAKSTRGQVRAILSGAFREAIQAELLAVNPALEAGRPQAGPGREARHMTPPDLAAAIRALEVAKTEGETAELLVTLALNLGARRGEMIALRWSDIDWRTATRSVTIARSISSLATGWHEKDTKTHSVREIPLTHSLRRRLWRQYARLVRVGREDGVVPVWVVADDPLAPWLPDRATKTWARIRDTAGLSGVRLHDLRHFVATQLLASGVSPVDVARLLGHADPSVTLRVYAAPTLDGQRRAANRMEDLLRGP